MAKVQQPHNWIERPLDPDYLLDSGLLFEINQSILHLFGIAMSVRNKTLVLLDSRKEPEKAIFDNATLEVGTHKLRNFMESFGSAQLERRRKHLGRAYQPKPTGV